MFTLSVMILLTCYGITNNLLVSCLLASGYLLAVGCCSRLLLKIGVALWLRIACQTVVAALLTLSIYWGYKPSEVPESTDPVAIDSGDGTGTTAAVQAQSKDERVRDFILGESPLVWQTYQELGGAIKVQDEKLAKLRETLVLFGQDAESDADFRALVQKRDDMLAAHDQLKVKMEEAYLQSRKFAAMPSSSEMEELKRKALEDGVREAECALQKFQELKERK